MSLAAPTLRIRRTEAAVARTDNRLDQLEVLCAVLAFVGLGYALMHFGGRARGSTEIALALAVPSLVVSRPWQTVSRRAHLVCAAVSLAVVAIPLITPLGVSRARDIESYLYAAVLYLAIRGFARDRDRRSLVAVGVLCLGIVESLDVIRVWKGEHDPSFQMVGTFYWHNQFGAFAAAVGVLATAMLMRSRKVEDGIAWLVAPLFLALTWLSHSRAALLAFLIAVSVLPLTALLRRQWWALARAACALALAFIVHGFFIVTVSGAGHTGQGFSPGKDSMSSTTAFRLTAAEEGLKVFAEAPLTSSGFGSLVVTGWRHVPQGATVSPYAHSAEVQALTDGGLLLGVPVIAALAMLGWSAVRGGVRSARRAAGPDWLPLGAGLAAVAMLLHTSMDFDSQYSVLGALLAALVAISAPHRRTPQQSRNWVHGVTVAVTVTCAVLATMLVSSFFRTSQRLDSVTSLLSSHSERSAVELRQLLLNHGFTDPRPAMLVVELADAGEVSFDADTLSRAVNGSRAYARLDPRFAPMWERVSEKARATAPRIRPSATG